MNSQVEIAGLIGQKNLSHKINKQINLFEHS